MIETLRFFAWPIDSNAKKVESSSSDPTNRSSTPSSTSNAPLTSSSSNELSLSTDKVDWRCDLHRCGLLLQLIEALEKCMYNAYEGAALALPVLPKVILYRNMLLVLIELIVSFRRLNSFLLRINPLVSNGSIVFAFHLS